MSKLNLNQKRLKEILTYNPDAGVFRWKTKYCKKIIVGSIAGNVEKNTKSGKKYICIGIDGNSYFAHRLAYLYMMGKFPNHLMDHENGDGCDNRWKNLRSVDHSENMKNVKMPSTNTSGVCGVSWISKRNKWESKIQVSGKTIHLGRFADLLSAACSRKSAEVKHKFHKNHGEVRAL